MPAPSLEHFLGGPDQPLPVPHGAEPVDGEQGRDPGECCLGYGPRA